MANEDFEDISSVTSSIFYAKKYSISKQKELLKFSFARTTHSQFPQIDKQNEQIEESVSSVDFISDTQKKDMKIDSKSKNVYKTQDLSQFYPNIPPAKETLLDHKEAPNKKNKSISVTKGLLLEALSVTKEKIKKKSDKEASKKKKTDTRQLKKKFKIKKDEIRNLKEFIPQQIIKKRNIIIQAENIEKEVNLEPCISKNSLFIDSDPFPFTSLSEWLLWHENYPELAFVREAYDIDQVPDETDIDVYIVNIMNEPEFFNPNWQIVGSKIHNISTVKFKEKPVTIPEWRISSSYTDGFSLFFEDIYQILRQNPKGIKNQRYPIFQFALKGLKLLELAYLDNFGRWHYKGTEKDLVTRVRILDQFVSQHDTKDAYKKISDPILAINSWYIGIISFDLVTGHSLFVNRFSKQSSITEDEKIVIIKNFNLNNKIIKCLKDIEYLDAINVKKIVKKLSTK